MSKKRLMMFFNTVDSQGGSPEQNNSEANEGREGHQEEPKTYTQDEVDELVKDLLTQDEVNKIVEKRVARERQKADEERKEAERLSKLTAEDRAKEESKKKDDEIARLRAEIDRNNLERDTIDRLNEEGLPVTFKSFLIGSDAETTNQAIKDFKSAYDLAVQDEVERRLTGKTPGGQGGSIVNDPWAKLSEKYKKK